jgi:hypothetical protein
MTEHTLQKNAQLEPIDTIVTPGSATTMLFHVLQKNARFQPIDTIFKHRSVPTVTGDILQKIGPFALSGAASLPHRSKYMVACLLTFMVLVVVSRSEVRSAYE